VNSLPSALKQELTKVLNTELIRTYSTSGGMINDSAVLETAQGRCFVKWNDIGLAHLFEREADGLRRLRAAGALRVPQVIAFSDDHRPAYLVLEYIERREPPSAAHFARRFGEGLAKMHLEQSASNGQFGLEADNYLGVFLQKNNWAKNWIDFYRDRRLLPQIALAKTRGRLPAYRERMLMDLVDRLEILLKDMPAQPVLLHGDLWSGNFLTAGEEAVIVDPAVYYGDREIEMAFVLLFGGFPSGFMEAYQSAYPLDEGFRFRMPLHQLYALLVHLNQFGEQYGADVERVCKIYA
jgi:fructosamine-3-kinase